MIVEYIDAWPRHFEEVRSVLAEALGTHVTEIEHIGSTAVEGMSGKPIVDIHMVVPDAAGMPAVIARLAELGYVHEGDKGVPGREAFRRKGPDVPFLAHKRDWYPHHLYASVDGALELRRHIAFRDHLRTNQDARADYAALKARLHEEHWPDREAYSEGKSDFVEGVMSALGLPPND